MSNLIIMTQATTFKTFFSLTFQHCCVVPSKEIIETKQKQEYYLPFDF